MWESCCMKATPIGKSFDVPSMRFLVYMPQLWVDEMTKNCPTPSGSDAFEIELWKERNLSEGVVQHFFISCPSSLVTNFTIQLSRSLMGPLSIL